MNTLKLFRYGPVSPLLLLFLLLLIAGAIGCAVPPPEIGTSGRRGERVFRLFLEVDDGDTVRYRRRSMRFLGVDTPEIAHPEHGFYRDQPFGQEARMFTRVQLKKARVVTYIAAGEDRYGRLLVHFFVDGYPLSVRIVEEGYGYETVSAFGDNGFPEIARMIRRASLLHPDLPFENPYQWRVRNRAP